LSLFVDTSAWYALLDRSDRSHERITAILGGAGELVLTDHVLVETHRLAAHRLGGAVADRFWTAVYDGQATLESVSPTSAGLSPSESGGPTRRSRSWTAPPSW
jgi:predicted nucleic acid-binding protein